VSRVPTFNRPARLLLTSCAFALAAAPASAATVSLKLTDPAGDSSGGAGTEVTGATVVQDTSKGTVTATVTLGAAPKAGSNMAIGLGKMKGGTCSIGTEGDGSMVFLLVLDAPPSGVWALDGDTAPHAVTPSLSGRTLKVSSGTAAALKKLSWDCANVAVQAQGDVEGEVVGDSVSGSGTGSATRTACQTSLLPARRLLARPRTGVWRSTPSSRFALARSASPST